MLLLSFLQPKQYFDNLRQINLHQRFSAITLNEIFQYVVGCVRVRQLKNLVYIEYNATEVELLDEVDGQSEYFLAFVIHHFDDVLYFRVGVAILL